MPFDSLADSDQFGIEERACIDIMQRVSRSDYALKRADELIVVGQRNAALHYLHDIVGVSQKRLRQIAPATLQAIMLKYVELAVDLKQGRQAREGLYQFRMVSQTQNAQGLQEVVSHFVRLAEDKVSTFKPSTAAAVAADAEAGVAGEIDDLETAETPDSLMLAATSGEEARDRTDKAALLSSIRFLWDTYQTVLELLRNNAKLEALYHETAQRAFGFCLRYRRKVELRRLCDRLSLHLRTLMSGGGSSLATMVSLANPETLQLHVDTRFVQLSTLVVSVRQTYARVVPAVIRSRRMDARSARRGEGDNMAAH